MGRHRLNLEPHNEFVGRIGLNIRRLRERAKWDVEGCAVHCEISVPVWYRIEGGQVDHLNGESLVAICTMFDVDLSELLRKPRKA